MRRDISIHVPLAGNVALGTGTTSPSRDFYPRSPCGERRGGVIRLPINPEISIHVPLAGNVVEWQGIVNAEAISIHVPLAGNVDSSVTLIYAMAEFLSTFPLRGTSSW